MHKNVGQCNHGPFTVTVSGGRAWPKAGESGANNATTMIFCARAKEHSLSKKRG